MKNQEAEGNWIFSDFRIYCESADVGLHFEGDSAKQALFMSNPPQSPSEGNLLPPRHRTTLGNLSQDTTELDLWAFEGDDLEPDPLSKEAFPTGASPKEFPRSRPHPLAPQTAENESVPKSVPVVDRIRMNISRSKGTTQSLGQPKSAAQAESDFDDLEQWEDVPRVLAAAMPETVEEPVRERNLAAAVESDAGKSPAKGILGEDVQIEELAVKGKEDRTEATASAVEAAPPISFKVNLGLSGLERIALGVFGVLLVSGMIWLGVVSIFRLPSEAHKVRSNDFPISGGIMTVTSAQTYWRTPKEGVDAVRRGTQLIPVLALNVGKGMGVIRVVFVDSEGQTVGDAFTRKVGGGENLTFSGTAGFDDIGMHAGYRTGDSPPWVVRVFEAPSENMQGQQFKLLFELNISPERR